MQLTEHQILQIQTRIKIYLNKTIILVNTMGDKSISSDSRESQFNIYCIDENNNIVWQASENRNPEFLHGDTFCYLGQNEKGEIVADRFSGFEYKINPDTGEATQIGFHK